MTLRAEDFQSWPCSEASVAERSDRPWPTPCLGTGLASRPAMTAVQAIERILMTGQYVVIELKKSQTSDDTVGQLKGSCVTRANIEPAR
jgi:hypothetical protein